jgi:hypothetical protein
MIIAIMGFAGTGKTMLGVWLSARYKYIGGYEIVSNVKSLTFSDYDVETQFIILIDSIKENRDILPKKKLLFVDEIQQYLDSREAMTSKNKKLTKYFYQVRKFGFDMIYTLQDFHSADIRLRRITEMYILPNYNKQTHILSFSIYDVYGEFIAEKRINITDRILNSYNTYEDIDNSVILT